MSQYLLNVIQPEGEPPPAPVLERVMKDLIAVRDEARAAGAWVFSAGLHAPSASTVVRMRDGEPLITDGPFVEGKEFVGGFTIIRAADLDEALAWARKYAAAITLPIEVRPIRDLDV
jgi:hypothetical protein